MTSFSLIGGGVMGEALLSRLLATEVYLPEAILVSEPVAARRDQLAQRYGVQVTDANSEAARADVVMLAIKPQLFDPVVQSLAHRPGAGQLVLSILAGTPLARLEAAFPAAAVVRAMPNTPATVGAGMTAIAAGRHADSEAIALAREIFEAVGSVVEVPESMMDAVTGLSGSGPAYVALVVEALADGGVAAGLPRAIAQQLALQTVLGTATLIRDGNLHPALLKDQVTSPGGTTIAGVAELEARGLRSALIEAVKAAKDRSVELGR